MSIHIAREFQGRWSSFWGTSYTFELELFDEYLFRRLGEPPLNATMLVDFRQLSKSLDALSPEARRQVQRANRDYLLRGIPLGSAFHPKTYFFGNAKEGVLLVGSGNLTMRGIEEGHEVFSRLDSRNSDDVASIRGWRQWMGSVVELTRDRAVAYRWLDLNERVPWLEGPTDGSRFVSNLTTSLVEQFADSQPRPVDELHVLAPYYDLGAHALRIILDRTAPRELYLYFGAGTSVDGNLLLSLLEASKALVTVRSFDPNEFVHAKLIGTVAGGTGRLLVGSANLSQAALVGSLAHESWANVEAGLVVDATPEAIRSIFTPSGLQLRDESVARVADLKFDAGDDGEPPPIMLRAATLLDDGRVEVALDAVDLHDALVTAGLNPQRLVERRTQGPLALPEGGALVWLCDADANRVSNVVPLDDPSRLRRWLDERTPDGERPRELVPSDYETPVGRMLLLLHERCIFDIEETDAASRARRLANEDAAAVDGNWDFLDELLKEELRYDPRVERYHRFLTAGLPEEDEVLDLLRIMLERTPEQRHLYVLGSPSMPAGAEATGRGTAWTPERRLQVRLFNVLERWCSALNDPRFAWIDQAAPVQNFSALVVALTECWEQRYLPEHRISHLLTTLLRTFVRAERSHGYLLSLEADERRQVLTRLRGETRLLVGALIYVVLRPQADWRREIFGLQPGLSSSIELGVAEVTDATPKLVERLVQESVTKAEVEERLLWSTTFIDDEHWCNKQARDLGLQRVALSHQSFNPRFGITLTVADSLDNPGIVSLVRQALAYRHVNGAIVEAGSTRLSVYVGDYAYASMNGVIYQSPDLITQDRLVALERQGVSWMRVLGISVRIA